MATREGDEGSDHAPFGANDEAGLSLEAVDRLNLLLEGQVDYVSGGHGVQGPQTDGTDQKRTQEQIVPFRLFAGVPVMSLSLNPVLPTRAVVKRVEDDEISSDSEMQRRREFEKIIVTATSIMTSVKVPWTQWSHRQVVRLKADAAANIHEKRKNRPGQRARRKKLAQQQRRREHKNVTRRLR
ncbi:hypothetical protein SeMB42_g02534 [Synchytrium endobioticum]|uniref:Uncharacterized protein n=1 Tax=Synchytrium endobioticum TaxID=286115 RepID=A0A507DDG7_9FUNG|nr:hypothetical protein SeMB42_g02534 [Synchytrium endobioticum]